MAGLSSLAAIFVQFLRFGLLAWGGPIAQIAMLRRELVDEQQWVSSDRFNRLLAVYQVLPGPEAHELCVHLGTIRCGRWGGLLAGLGFMLPGVLLILTLAWGYTRLDLTGGPFAPLFLGAQIGVIALVVRAVHKVGTHVLVTPLLWAISLAVRFRRLSGSGLRSCCPRQASHTPFAADDGSAPLGSLSWLRSRLPL